MTTARDDLAKSEAILVAAIEVNVPELVVARTAISNFQSMIRSKTARKLDEWLEAARNSLVGSFAGGGEKDLDAVRSDHTLEVIQRQSKARFAVAHRRSGTSANVRQSPKCTHPPPRGPTSRVSSSDRASCRCEARFSAGTAAQRH